MGNWKTYSDWRAGKKLEDFQSYINKDGTDLNGREIARDVGIHETALRQNPTIVEDLNKVKERMRDAGLLSPKGAVNGSGEGSEGKSGKDTLSPGLTRKERKELEDLKVLVPSLKEEIRSLREAVLRYKKMEKYLAECGMLLR